MSLNIMYSLILLSSVLYITTCTLYTVTPDDHYYPNTTSHRCHNLQHYLLNVTKYFTSNTQLLFLPGVHHLHTDLIIQNAHNISLIGSTVNGTTLDTIIECDSTDSVGVLISNITNITIEDLKIQYCTMVETEVSIAIFSSLNVYMKNLIIFARPQLSIIATNVLKEFSLLNITSKGIKINYMDNDSYLFSFSMQQGHTTLNIDNFTLIPRYKFIIPQYQLINPLHYYYFNARSFNPLFSYTTVPYGNIYNEKFASFVALTINLLQNTYNVSIKLSNTTFYELYDYEMISIINKNCKNNIKNRILVNKCNFKNNNSSLLIYLITLTTIVCDTNFTSGNSENLVVFQNCLFCDNDYERGIIKFDYNTEMISDVHGIPPKILLHIVGCIFRTNANRFIEFSGARLQTAKLFVKNTNFEKSFVTTAIHMSNVSLVFIGPVIFSEIKALWLLKTDPDITFYNDVEFSSIETDNLIRGTSYLNVMENALMKVRNNKISSYAFSFDSDKSHLYKLCYFQFYRTSDNNLNFTKTAKHIINIEIAFENVRQVFDANAGNINCKFNPHSLYYGLNPLQVYSTHIIIQFTNSNNKNFSFDTGLLCRCQGTRKNCHTNFLEPIYPGQLLKLHISLNPQITIDGAMPITVKVYDNDSPHTICKVSSLLEGEQVVYQNCTEVTYNILSETTQHCKLILYNADYEFPTVFFIKLLNCPAGFIKCIVHWRKNASVMKAFIQNFQLQYVTLIIRPYYVLLTVGCLLYSTIILTFITFLYTVHSFTACLTHRTLISQLPTHSVSLIDLVCCVDTANKVSVLSLVL